MPNQNIRGHASVFEMVMFYLAGAIIFFYCVFCLTFIIVLFVYTLVFFSFYYFFFYCHYCRYIAICLRLYLILNLWQKPFVLLTSFFFRSFIYFLLHEVFAVDAKRLQSSNTINQRYVVFNLYCLCVFSFIPINWNISTGWNQQEPMGMVSLKALATAM